MQNLICQWHIQFVKKVSLRLMGCPKCYFLLFAFSFILNYRLLSKMLQWVLWVLGNFYSVTNIFELHFFEDETAALLIFFTIFTDMHFGSLFFRNEKKNMTTSLSMIHLKCTVVHYTNLNWSSKNKPFLN